MNISRTPSGNSTWVGMVSKLSRYLSFKTDNHLYKMHLCVQGIMCMSIELGPSKSDQEPQMYSGFSYESHKVTCIPTKIFTDVRTGATYTLVHL